MVAAAQKQTLNFQAEVKQVLQLMIHSLYSNKEIFLRELISNSSDALDKLRFGALNDAILAQKNQDLKILVDIDKDQRTITISDNGIGMTRDEVMSNLGTIAKSGTREFLKNLTGDQAKDANLIGQFGVGFYSTFIVADKVSVLTRHAGSDEAVLWESDGQGDYTLEDAQKPEHGTQVTLHLKADEDEFLDEHRLQNIISKYSDHISFPVLMQKDGQYEAVNKATALWTCNKSEISDEDYKSFYKHISHDFADPLAWTHNRVEGTTSYINLLYIPSQAPFDLWNRDYRRGIKLYVQRVFIMDEAENFMPHYLRFIRGVIDSSDLPLNVSREILQNNKVVETIRKGSVKKILNLLDDLAKNSPEKYQQFWNAFGEVFKEGTGEDFANKDQIAQLLRFASTHDASPDQKVTLKDYVARMQASQKHIYYVTADTLAGAKSSPHLEIFRKKNIEVLLLHHRVDEWLVSHLTEFEGKTLQSITKGELDLGDIEKPEDDKSFTDLITKFKEVLGDRVKDVRMTYRLTESPACVVTDEFDMGRHMQKILESAGQAVPESKPILELNPEHPLVKKLHENLNQPQLNDWAQVLLDQALLTEGSALPDPAAFVKRLNQLLVG
ncbi:MAG: molecular chaperone HtpG [Legionellales bacterium]|jgi:molecular chaperone HtpG